ncbi:MAG: hypothetical protein AB8B71_03315 [Paracoccaceae bacterium]
MSVSACTQFPQLEGLVEPEVADRAYPALRPLAPLIPTPSLTVEDQNDLKTDLSERVAALKSRADEIRLEGIDPQTRTRMANGVQGASLTSQDP